MKLVELIASGTHCLECSCNNSHFRIEFRKSESTLRYEELRREDAASKGYPFTPGTPDTMVAICIRCSQVITITDTTAKVPSYRTTPTYDRATGYWSPPQRHGPDIHSPIDHVYYEPKISEYEKIYEQLRRQGYFD